MNDVDLVYDATGDPGVGLFLCDLAFDRGALYVSVSTTQGAWGGRAALMRPKQGPCFECLHSHLRDEESLEPEERRLTPPQDPTGEIRPEVCADATFTGAGMDVTHVALVGVRLAIAALCEGHEHSYPTLPWNVLMTRFRDSNGIPEPGSNQESFFTLIQAAGNVSDEGGVRSGKRSVEARRPRAPAQEQSGKEPVWGISYPT